MGCERHRIPDKGACQHDAFERDVDNARALAHDPAQGRQGQRRGGDQGLREQPYDILMAQKLHYTAAVSSR